MSWLTVVPAMSCAVGPTPVGGPGGSGRRMTIVTSDTGTVVLVERALDQTAAIIAAIPGRQAAGWPRPVRTKTCRRLCVTWPGRICVTSWLPPAVPPRAGRRRQASPARTGPRNSGTAPQLMVVWRAADLDEHVAMPGGGRTALRSRADQRSPSWPFMAGTWPWPPASRPAWTRPWLSTRSTGRARCSGPSSAGQVGHSARRCRCGRMRRSASGWQAGPAATRNGRQQAARPVTGPEPLLLGRLPAP